MPMKKILEKTKRWNEKDELVYNNALLDKYLNDEHLSSSELRYLKRTYPNYFGGRKKRRRRTRRKSRRKTRRRKSRRRRRRRRKTKKH